MEIDAFANSEESLISYELLKGYKEENTGAIETTWRERRVPRLPTRALADRLPIPPIPERNIFSGGMTGGGGREDPNDLGDDLT